jgi:hydroxymethylpyrimidine pyrophosphatase-like HAD family hydrolase
MKKYLIFDLDGTLIQSDKQISEIIYKYIADNIDIELIDKARYIIENNQ